MSPRFSRRSFVVSAVFNTTMTVPKIWKDKIFPVAQIVKRAVANKKTVPYVSEKRVNASQENSFEISRRFPMIGKGWGPGG
jgi:hypothetical protein